MPSVSDRNLQIRVVDPAIWWRLPTATLLYERRTDVSKWDPACTSSFRYCVIPKARLSCARSLAPRYAYPLPRVPLSAELESFSNECKMSSKVYTRDTVVLGLYRADIMFDWLGMSTAALDEQ